MGQSVKEMIIRLNGEVGSGANKIGDYLTGLGSALDRVGKHTREFQEESLNVYRSYEDQMLAARYAMSAQVDSATELERQMAGLDNAARKWASTSIFHTDDVSKAINEAAHAGWNYQEILEGIPQAMLIAQAGGMDLSSGLDYLVKMMNATKTPMSDIGTIVDQWAMAANISATNIDELGEAFMSMGASAQFGDSTAELFSLLAALANVGTTGSQAGTALRSTMMRLIAPTTKAEAAMDLLGADAEELQEVLTDTNVTKAAKTLEGLGFSAFDRDTGKLKPIKQIFEELFKVTENLDEASKDELLAAIFPTRTIATALSLLSASNGELDEIFNKVSNSQGYAKKGSDIMMSGLTGSIETLMSKWEEFERTIGKTMAPHIEKIANGLGNIVDGLNNLPPEAISGINSMLTALSTVGPLLIGVGSISKLVGLLGPIGTGALMAGLGVSYLVGYLGKLSQIDFESNFGTLSLDIQELGEYVDSIETKFDVEQKAITQWSDAVSKAQENYQTALNGMNEGLLKKVLTGGTFTKEDFDSFTKLGDDIVKYTMEGIENAEARDQSLLQALFGDKTTDEETEAYDNVSGLLDFYYSGLSEEARAIGEGIRDKMTEALKNGELTADDRAAIQAQVARLNQINAEIAAAARKQEYYVQLEKAGRMSWDTLEGFLKDNEQKLTAAQSAIDDQYDNLKAGIRTAFEWGRKNGDQTVTFTDANGNKRTVDLSEESEQAAYTELERERAAAHASENEKFGGISETAFDAAMRDSSMGDAWEFIKGLYRQYGGVPTDENGDVDFTKLGLAGKTDAELESLYGQLYKLFRTDSDWFGLGTGKLSEVLKPFAGYEGVAGLLAMLGNDFGYMTAVTDYQNRLYDYQHFNRDPLGLFGTPEDLEKRYNAGKEYRQTELELEAANARLNELKNKQAGYQTEIDKHEKWLQGEDRPLFYKGDEAARASLEGYQVTKGEIDLQVADAEAKVTELENKIAGMNTEKDVLFGVDSSEVDQWVPPEKKGNVVYTVGDEEGPEGFATGGRATEASIFGEAGPEWAIPEAHTERTAELLNAARQASGFTWGDLITRFGGLNANAQNSPVVLNYSPVITTSDANGVAGILAADKERVLRMIRQALEESRYRDSVEAYA